MAALAMQNDTDAIGREGSSRILETPQGKAQLCVYVLTFLLGSVGNVLVLLVVRAKKHRTVNDLFIANLAISDLLMISFLPVYFVKMFIKFHHSTAFCKTISPMVTVTFFVSVFTLTSMAVHRCYVITNPFKPVMRRWKIVIWLIGLWIASFLAVLPLVIVAKGGFGTECKETWDFNTGAKVYTVCLFVLQYSLPLIIITAAYIRIAVDLLKSSTERYGPGKILNENHRCEDNGPFRTNVCHEDIQVLKTVAVIVLVFAICLLPIQLSWMMGHFGGEREQRISKNVFTKFDFLLSIFHSCLNPLVYGTLTRRFRRGYVKYLVRMCPCLSKVFNFHSIGSPSHDNSFRRHHGTFAVGNENDKFSLALNDPNYHNSGNQTKTTPKNI
ncbi:melatonin receptor type 1B-like isoform X1 [Montipora capricornis]|uniref:melatonin receptor type 1B-like isoform X1 n=1 Tax=Montipora capricornis TaxID=246305 RepID=UPI0035F1A93D